MHPELLNNSLFIRYYGQWQKDPSSVVFVPIADYFMRYNQLDDALKICEMGIKNHPELISGHLMLAKIYIKKNEWGKAADSIKNVLAIVPDHVTAKELMKSIERGRVEPQAVAESPAKISQEEVKSLPKPEKITAVSPPSISKPSPDFECDDEITEEMEIEISMEAKPYEEYEDAVSTTPRAPSWETVTMANIYSAQGHHARAKKIYQAILSREPGNADAKRGLEYLSKVSQT